MRILLAEDNRVNQMLAVRLLENMGYQADIVNNGQEAISALERNLYDVVLMDVQMPEMDGPQATRTDRSSSTRPTPGRASSASTAKATQGDRELCLDAGMNGLPEQADSDRGIGNCSGTEVVTHH